MRVVYETFGCKANQYDTERIRQELEARGAETVGRVEDADVCIVNTCTVTSQADAQARSRIRAVHRRKAELEIVVVGCSAALRAGDYRALPEVASVVGGHDAVEIAEASARSRPRLVQLGARTSLDRMDGEPVAGEILLRREGRSRAWLKIQDGCDRKCSFCATRLARGASRSRSPDEIVREARALSATHREIVLTGIHIGHYGRDLERSCSLSGLVVRLLEEVHQTRFRLGSVEATEIDDLLLDLLADSGGRLAPHLHMPLQSGADPVLRRMRRWYTRDMYRARALEIAGRLPVLGLGADIITGYPGETDADHRDTVALVEELPYTYLHVFPFSPREQTAAETQNRSDPVPQRVAGERSRELRELVDVKGRHHRRARAGDPAVVILEGEGNSALTGDYLRARVSLDDREAWAAQSRARTGHLRGPERLRGGILRWSDDDLAIDLTPKRSFT
ncbi:MAG: MiaB/RimO family radical SAM methylthiotransferase [Gemmatimonadota bacterium]